MRTPIWYVQHYEITTLKSSEYCPPLWNILHHETITLWSLGLLIRLSKCNSANTNRNTNTKTIPWNSHLKIAQVAGLGQSEQLGSRARGWVQRGPDGLAHNLDDDEHVMAMTMVMKREKRRIVTSNNRATDSYTTWVTKVVVMSVSANMADMVVMEVRVIMMVVTFALKTSRTSMQMLRLIVLFLSRNPNFLSSSLERGVKATTIIVSWSSS